MTNTPFELKIGNRTITITPDRTEDHEDNLGLSGSYTMTEADQLQGTITFNEEEWEHDDHSNLSDDDLDNIVKLMRERFASNKDE